VCIQTMVKALTAAVLLACLCAPNVYAQAEGGVPAPSSAGTAGGSGARLANDGGPDKGSNEWQVWAGWSFPLDFRTSAHGAHILIAGVRYGRVLTHAHGPGFLRGRLEWAGDVVPVVEIWLPGRRVYGAGIDPVVLKWNFVTRRGLSPYWEFFSGGGLFSNHQVVPGTTTFNFMPSSALGLRFPWGRSGKYDWNAEVRWFHISNAGITNYNPGVNTLQIRIGFGWFSQRE
jgi:Lipid A 3-O-deacylase (PagL)